MTSKPVSSKSSLPDFDVLKHHISPSLMRGTKNLSGINYIRQVLANMGDKISAFRAQIKTYRSTGIWIDKKHIENTITQALKEKERTFPSQAATLSSVMRIHKDMREILTTLKATRLWINHLAGLEQDKNPKKINALINQTEHLENQAKQVIEEIKPLILELQHEQSLKAQPGELTRFIETSLKDLIKSPKTSPIMIKQLVTSLQTRLNLLEEMGVPEKEIDLVRTKLDRLVIPKNPLPPKTKKSLKTIGGDKIIAHNRREVVSERIPLKLRRAFEAAQEHLDVEENPHWESANTKKLHSTAHSANSSPQLGAVGIASAQGHRFEMEDEHLAKVLLPDSPHPISLYGIFDGHGGGACSQYLKDNLPQYLQEKLPLALISKDKDAAIFNLLKQAMVELGKRYKEMHPYSGAGSTANFALIIENELWVANVGDTRSIISTNGIAMALSEDAKPSLKTYARGAEKRGGRVRPASRIDVARVEKNIGSALAMGRAVGHDEVESGINPRAKVVKISLDDLPPGQNFLVIGCDGLWDVASSIQVAATTAREDALGKTPKQIASTLVHKAYDVGSTDNISTLVLDLSSIRKR